MIVVYRPDLLIDSKVDSKVNAHAALNANVHGVSASGFEDKVNRNIPTGYPIINAVVKYADYTLTATDYAIMVDSSGGNVTISLPTAVGIKGRTYHIKKIDASANNVIINAGTETIDDNATVSTNIQYESYTIVSDGANWLII